MERRFGRGTGGWEEGWGLSFKGGFWDRGNYGKGISKLIPHESPEGGGRM